MGDNKIKYEIMEANGSKWDLIEQLDANGS
jgi:hypothetical protein